MEDEVEKIMYKIERHLDRIGVDLDVQELDDIRCVLDDVLEKYGEEESDES